MPPHHDVNGPCTCPGCGGHLPVKLAKGGNSPGHHYIHCALCNYHYTFPKQSVVDGPSPPPVSQSIACAKVGCKRRGSTQCSCYMCKQCCVLLSGSNLRAHTVVPISQTGYISATNSSLLCPMLPFMPATSVISGPSRPVVPLSSPSTTPSSTVQTVPYQPPSITQHMNKDWMRPTVDNTKKAKRPNRVNLDNRFSLVLWLDDGKPPKICAVHECPRWPKWILMDDIALKEELAIEATLLEYYDTRTSQWITCGLSYPHDVKRDGSLLLRLLGTLSCLDLEKHIQQTTSREAHFRSNMAHERSDMRRRIRKWNIEASPFVVSLSDDEDDVEIVEFQSSPSLQRKRQHDDELDSNAHELGNNPRPLQRSRYESPTTLDQSLSLSFPHHDTPKSFSPLPSRSSSVTTVSPRPTTLSLDDEVFVPETSKPWPAGMYAVDMALGFERVRNLEKKAAGNLQSRLLVAFGRKIPTTTYHDHMGYWKALTEQQHVNFKQAGRTVEGLWSTIPKVK
ncbi:hypothetical protein BYT27DRAFT_7071774, partial [Phlegmacium glaucopus]